MWFTYKKESNGKIIWQASAHWFVVLLFTSNVGNFVTNNSNCFNAAEPWAEQPYPEESNLIKGWSTSTTPGVGHHWLKFKFQPNCFFFQTYLTDFWRSTSSYCQLFFLKQQAVDQYWSEVCGYIWIFWLKSNHASLAQMVEWQSAEQYVRGSLPGPPKFFHLL